MTPRRVFKTLAFIFAMSLIAAGALAYFAAPAWMKNKIVTSIQQSCPKCEIKIGELDLSLSKGRVTFRDLQYEDAPGGHSRVAVQAKKLQVQVRLKSLIKKPIVIEDIRGEGVKVTLTEDPSVESAPDDHSPPFSQLPPLVFQHTEVSESAFHYIHLVQPKASSLLLTQVKGTIGGWSTRKKAARRFTPERTAIYATGVLEKSGRFVVEAHADPLEPRGTAQIHVDVRDQALENVDSFFSHEVGIHVKGTVFQIFTDLQVSGGAINGTLKARYFGLGVKVDDPKSSEVKNFIETLGVDLSKKNDQGINGQPMAEKPVEGKREPNQSLFSAIFHALGSSAKKLVKG